MSFGATKRAALAALGWDDSVAEAYAAYDPRLIPGRITRVDRGAAMLALHNREVRADYTAEVRRAAAVDPIELPCVGDWAVVRRLPADRAELVALLPRRTALVRSGVARGSRAGLSGDSRGQVLAANIDLVLIAEPAAPDTDLGRIERLQALAWESGAIPVVVVTKADLADDLPSLLSEVALAAPGADVHAVSAITGEGVEAVRPPAGRTAVLLGPSGAGKSTLLNALAGAEVMGTQQVRAADGRGRHTTTRRELIRLPGGGIVIDTPGIRRVGLYDTSQGLSQAFSDLEEIAEGCRFADCRHESEPGCAVLEAIAAGALPRRRLESWRKLDREAEWLASRTDARLRAERDRRWKLIHKEMRRSGRNRP